MSSTWLLEPLHLLHGIVADVGSLANLLNDALLLLLGVIAVAPALLLGGPSFLFATHLYFRSGSYNNRQR